MTYCEDCKKMVNVVSNCCGGSTEFVEFKGNICNECNQRCLDVCALCGSSKIRVD